MAGLLITDAIATYATYLRVEKNLSARTTKAYLYDLGRFVVFLQGPKKREIRLDDVSTLDIKEYLHHLQAALAYKPTTLGRVIASIRVFLEYCVEQRLLQASPAQSIHNPKLPKKLPIYLIEDEVQKLFDAPDQSTPGGRRDRAIMVTLAFTGIRLQELVGLDTLDVDFLRRTIKVFGKGSKERLIPLNDQVLTTLKAHLEDPERAPVPGERAVFLNARGKRLTGRAVEYIVEKYVRESGILKDKISPHKLRHTFATLLHIRDVDLVDIQTLMGHATITSTQIYTHTNASKLHQAVDKLKL